MSSNVEPFQSRRYTDFVSRWKVRAISLVVATILAGMPAVATACEWACSHDAAKGHGDHVFDTSSVDHHHHEAAAIANVSETRFAAAVSPEQDCCGDVTVSPASVRAGRIDAGISPTFDSFVTAETMLQTLRSATATHLSRTAPPGWSSQTARSLPLRI
jgi:hypothetical protein